jgi:hypothetical protein
MQCPNCGSEVPDSAKVCGYCGQRLKAAAPAEPVPPIESPKPQPAPQAVPAKPVEPAPPAEAPKPQPAPEALSARPVEPKPVKPAKPKKQGVPRKFPVWGWAVIGLAILAGVGVLLSSLGVFPGNLTFGAKPAQSVILSRACGSQVSAHSDASIKLLYGYWGTLEKYYQTNYQNMEFQLYIDGKRYYGTRSKTAVKLSEIPCADRSNWDDNWWEHGMFMYDTIQIEPLDPGYHQIEVVYYLRASVQDGAVGDDGYLITYNPGEIIRYPFTLRIE